LQAVESSFAKLEVLRFQLAGNCSCLQNPVSNERLQRAKQLSEEAKAALRRISSGTVPSLQFVFIIKQITEQLHSFMLPQLISYETCSVYGAAEGGTVAAAQAAWTEVDFSLPETAPLPELLNRYHAFVTHSVQTWVAQAESNLQLRATVAVAGSLTSLQQQSQQQLHHSLRRSNSCCRSSSTRAEATALAGTSRVSNGGAARQPAAWRLHSPKGLR